MEHIKDNSTCISRIRHMLTAEVYDRAIKLN